MVFTVLQKRMECIKNNRNFLILDFFLLFTFIVKVILDRGKTKAELFYENSSKKSGLFSITVPTTTTSAPASQSL